MIRTILLVGTLLAVSACVSTSASSLREDTGTPAKMHSEKNYQEAYRILSERFERCDNGIPIGEKTLFGNNMWVVKSNLDTKKQIGVVEVLVQNMFLDNYAFVVETAPEGEGSSITLYSHSVDDFDDESMFGHSEPERIKSWLNGNTACLR